MIVVLDGPEKAGKSTFVDCLKKASTFPTSIRKWGPIKSPDEYLYALKEDVLRIDDLIIWDRSWASEVVYCELLPRDGELRDKPWVGEVRYGSLMQSVGIRLMLLGPSIEALSSLRDSSDHRICVSKERTAFFRYAITHGWMFRMNRHNVEYATLFAQAIIAYVEALHEHIRCLTGNLNFKNERKIQ